MKFTGVSKGIKKCTIAMQFSNSCCLCFTVISNCSNLSEIVNKLAMHQWLPTSSQIWFHQTLKMKRKKVTRFIN